MYMLSFLSNLDAFLSKHSFRASILMHILSTLLDQQQKTKGATISVRTDEEASYLLLSRE